MVGKSNDFLFFRFKAHLGTAKNDDQFRPDALERGHHLCGFRNVPDVHAQTDDARILRQHDLGDIERALVNVEFEQDGPIPQLTKIGKQIAQSQGGVDIFRVKCG